VLIEAVQQRVEVVAGEGLLARRGRLAELGLEAQDALAELIEAGERQGVGDLRARTEKEMVEVRVLFGALGTKAPPGAFVVSGAQRGLTNVTPSSLPGQGGMASTSDRDARAGDAREAGRGAA